MTRRRGLPLHRGLLRPAWRAMAVTIAAAITIGLGGEAEAQGTPALHSPNWSGYVVVACSTCKLRYVTATWTIPAASCASSPPTAMADFWVGLDGETSGSTEQIGTADSCTNGQPSYFAWYQMYPAQPIVAYGPGRWSYDVNAGDLISASVYYDAAAGWWQLTLDDHTSGLAVTTDQPCPPGIQCDNADAEVIAEAPNAGANLPLADFGAVTYSSIGITSRNGTRGGMASNPLWTVRPINLIGATGTTLASPGPVRAVGTAFTDMWRAAQ